MLVRGYRVEEGISSASRRSQSNGRDKCDKHFFLLFCLLGAFSKNGLSTPTSTANHLWTSPSYKMTLLSLPHIVNCLGMSTLFDSGQWLIFPIILDLGQNQSVWNDKSHSSVDCTRIQCWPRQVFTVRRERVTPAWCAGELTCQEKFLKAWFVAFVNFCDVNIPAMTNFKLPAVLITNSQNSWLTAVMSLRELAPGYRCMEPTC